ncbi:hypothetical protein [Streptomyces sp. 7N604]|uniref:hypothetical protein n=1 Tax=Streptomyces sp. 7N604 TaxID=3457415 RepID=UPI003FD06440
MPERDGFLHRITDTVRDALDGDGDDDRARPQTAAGAKAPDKGAPEPPPAPAQPPAQPSAKAPGQGAPQPAPQGPPPGPGTGRPDPEVAKVIYLVGRELQVSDKAMLAGFEAALVESGMENLNHGDRDSVGVFQQRPSQGWGSPAQCMNVNYATHKFFERAIKADRDNPGFTPGQLAQKVQVSAFPERYDQREAEAKETLKSARESVEQPPPGNQPQPPPPPPADNPRLDVQFDMSQRKPLFAELLTYMLSNGHEFVLPPGMPEPGGRRSSSESFGKVMEHDALITGLSQTFRIRKSLIQTVIFWEYRGGWGDPIGNGLVMAYYAYKEWEEIPVGEPPPAPYPKEDASTGVAKIFAKTAIRARNHAIGLGLIPEPPLNIDDWHVVWDVWQRLFRDERYNVSTVPLVHIHSAHLIGVKNPDRLRFSDDETRDVLARYNGEGDEAAEYGRRALDLYRIFEKYNARLRG